MDSNAHQVNVPRTAILPRLQDVREFEWDREQARSQGIFGFNSRDLFSRPFNLIRAKLLKLRQARGWNRVGIVSATPGVGKSFIATNLAAALSRKPDFQTYLIDLDLRRGSVASNFGCRVDGGVRTYLEGETNNLFDVSFRLSGERLIVVPTDRSPARSAELLSGAAMDALVDDMRGPAGDAMFLFDLPPVFANDDAAIVVNKIDAYVLVAEEGHTTKKQLSEALNTLDPSRCAGVVLNHFSGGIFSDTYGHSYGSSKEYGAYF